jgi:hypothetical protein
MRFPDYDRTLVLPALSPDLQPDSSRTHDCREPAGDPLTGVTHLGPPVPLRMAAWRANILARLRGITEHDPRRVVCALPDASRAAAEWQGVSGRGCRPGSRRGQPNACASSRS